MKKLFTILPILLVFIIGSSFLINNDTPIETPEAEVINWMTWEEAYEANKENPKKIFIDVYTDWCGWCKKMDKTTFMDKDIVKYMNEHFYAVKFDAEQKEIINFNDRDFKFVANGRRGFHELAYSLLDGRLGYPAFVMLDEAYSRIMLSPGYKKSDQLMEQLEYAASDSYKTSTWKEYRLQKN